MNIYEKIRFDMDRATLEEVDIILSNYNKNPNYNINPMAAASLNARYHELTGKDHPVYLSEQLNVLNKELEDEQIIIDGKPSLYQRLKNNITGEGLGITVLPSKRNSYVEVFDKIKLDIDRASLEEVDAILNHYNDDSVVLGGIQSHYEIPALAGASLNARYHELTGVDHLVYTKYKEQKIKEETNGEYEFTVNGKPSIYKLLLDGTVEISTREHITRRTYDIVQGVEKASLEEVDELLKYFNGNPIIINGLSCHPYNDPMTAAKLNNRYKELTGVDHPNYLVQIQLVVDDYLREKATLLGSGSFNESYFETLIQMKEYAASKVTIETSEKKKFNLKEIFLRKRKEQRKKDQIERQEQLSGVKVDTDTDSLGGIKR